MIKELDDNVFEIRDGDCLKAFGEWLATSGITPPVTGEWRDMVAFQAGYRSRQAEIFVLQDRIRHLESQVFGGKTN